MSGNDAAKTAKIEVWWDMKDCPIPEGYDAGRVRPSIERAFKERGYTGPVSITAYADQTQTPCHVLRGLSSTGVAEARAQSCIGIWWNGEEAIKPPDTKLLSATKTWARNYPATPEHATANIHVLWDMNDCPIPEGYDARRVRPSIERAFKEIGYSGPISITAYADQKQTPLHHLLSLSSTGVDFAHTLPWVHYSRMISDFERWSSVNPAPASILIISDEVASSKPFEMPLLVTSAEWLWDSLLAVSETRRHTLEKCSESERVVASTGGMFCCKLCLCDCKSLDDFNKHLSSKEHTKEENRITTHSQSFPRRHREFKISKYHDEARRISSQDQTYEESTPERFSPKTITFY
ncbi:hypothetical protein Bca4012_015110 [Brassica carinata]